MKMSTNNLSSTGAAIALLAMAPIFDNYQKNFSDSLHIEFSEHAQPTGSGVAGAFIDDRALAHLMHTAFERLSESQTEIEDEFKEAIYSNRSELYTQF